MASAVTAASSATGRSDVPALTTMMSPTPSRATRLDDDEPRLRVDRALEAGGQQGLDHGRIGAGRQDVVVTLRKPAHDGHDLRRGLALAEDGLRDAMAERAVKIHPREAEILDGQVAKPRQRLVGLERSRRDRLEELPYFFLIHASASLALPLRNPCRSSVT